MLLLLPVYSLHGKNAAFGAQQQKEFLAVLLLLPVYFCCCQCTHPVVRKLPFTSSHKTSSLLSCCCCQCTLLLPVYSTCGKEAALGIQQQEEIITGLVAVASVQEVLQRHRALGRADDVDWLALCPPKRDSNISQTM